MAEWEAICVDDGSTDSTLDVLRHYEKADARFRVIALNENLGAAGARNVAVRACVGEYVCFLDSDDWFSPDALESAVSVFETHPRTDSVLFQCDYVYDNRCERYPLPDFSVLSGDEAIGYSLLWSIHGVYAVRSEIHKRYLYDESAHWYSDDNTTHYHYLASREVRVCDGVYKYRQRSSSITHSVSIRHFDVMISADSLRTNLSKMGANTEVMILVEKKRWLVLVDSYRYLFVNRRKFSAAERRDILKLIRRVWAATDVSLLSSSLRHHFGYIPFLGHWWLFRIEEELYFFLRMLLGRN